MEDNPNIWCVPPEERVIDGLKFVDRYGIEHSFWIKVKKFLTVGEAKRMRSSGFGALRSGGEDSRKKEREIDVDWSETAFSRVRAYLLDWSLESDPAKHIKLPISAIESLEEDAFDAIDKAIDQHRTEMEAEKKRMAGGSKPSPTPA